MNRLAAALLLAVAAGFACTGAPEQAAEESVELGPADGHDLPGVDLDRVQVGQLAPDFTVAALGAPPLTLSDLRGSKNVVLVFYRGHW